IAPRRIETSLCGARATRVEKPNRHLDLNGRGRLSFRFEAASIASRRIDEFMWCAMATRAKKTKQPPSTRVARDVFRFGSKRPSTAPRRIDEFMWCDGNTTSPKKPKSQPSTCAAGKRAEDKPRQGEWGKPAPKHPTARPPRA